MRKLFGIAAIVSLCIGPTSYAEPDWNAPVPENGRSNPYNLDTETFQIFRDRGQIHTQIYPVSITGALPPYGPIETILESADTNVFRKWLNQIFKSLAGIHKVNDVLELVG